MTHIFATQTAFGPSAFLRTPVFQTTAILIFPLIWGINGIWLPVAAAELMSLVPRFVFLFRKRKKYRYF